MLASGKIHPMHSKRIPRAGLLACAAVALLIADCGGSGSGSATPPAAMPTLTQVSAASNLGGTCGLATSGNAGEAYTSGSAVQPQLAANPANASTVALLWEQDRWNAIGARAIESPPLPLYKSGVAAMTCTVLVL